jgi:hypothetical protein
MTSGYRALLPHVENGTGAEGGRVGRSARFTAGFAGDAPPKPTHGYDRSATEVWRFLLFPSVRDVRALRRSGLQKSAMSTPARAARPAPGRDLVSQHGSQAVDHGLLLRLVF